MFDFLHHEACLHEPTASIQASSCTPCSPHVIDPTGMPVLRNSKQTWKNVEIASKIIRHNATIIEFRCSTIDNPFHHTKKNHMVRTCLDFQRSLSNQRAVSILHAMLSTSFQEINFGMISEDPSSALFCANLQMCLSPWICKISSMIDWRAMEIQYV